MAVYELQDRVFPRRNILRKKFHFQMPVVIYYLKTRPQGYHDLVLEIRLETCCHSRLPMQFLFYMMERKTHKNFPKFLGQISWAIPRMVLIPLIHNENETETTSLYNTCRCRVQLRQNDTPGIKNNSEPRWYGCDVG